MAAGRGGERTAAANRVRARSSRRRGERWEHVLDAATRMFHEKGYANTAVEDVAGSVGLLKGSLYHYIESKEDLLFGIVEDVHQDVQETLEEALGERDLPPLERLVRFARNQVKYNALNVTRISVYHHEWTRLEGDRLADIRRRRRRHEQAIVTLLTEARERGDVGPELDVKLAASCVFATIIWPYTWYRPGSVSPHRLASFCSEFIINGLVGPR